MKTLPWLLFLPLAGGSLFLSQRWLDEHVVETHALEEGLYLTDPELIRRLSFGYDSLVADLYWLRTVQYYGGKRKDVPKQNYDLLASLLRITTDLDPGMILAYRFGAIFLSEPQPFGAGDVEGAMRLLDEGIRQNPDAWQLLFDKGFIYYWQLKDYNSAAEWFLKGSSHPDSPEWLNGLTAFALERGGDVETAKLLWSKQYEESPNRKMRNNALAHLRSIGVDEDLWTLDFLIDRFRDAQGRNPSSWDDLLRKGLLKSVPRDPTGRPYELDDSGGFARPAKGSSLKHYQSAPGFKARFLEKLAAKWR